MYGSLQSFEKAVRRAKTSCQNIGGGEYGLLAKFSDPQFAYRKGRLMTIPRISKIAPPRIPAQRGIRIWIVRLRASSF